jgi:hypothetical protein
MFEFVDIMQIICKNCAYFGGIEQRGDQIVMRCLRFWDAPRNENPDQYFCDDFSLNPSISSEK